VVVVVEVGVVVAGEEEEGRAGVEVGAGVGVVG
jgi:hypothetical protein